VRPLRGTWSYCPGSQTRGHAWQQIEATSRDRLERYALKRAPEVAQ
jgi:hypothetical protein